MTFDLDKLVHIDATQFKFKGQGCGSEFKVTGGYAKVVGATSSDIGVVTTDH